MAIGRHAVTQKRGSCRYAVANLLVRNGCIRRSDMTRRINRRGASETYLLPWTRKSASPPCAVQVGIVNGDHQAFPFEVAVAGSYGVRQLKCQSSGYAVACSKRVRRRQGPRVTPRREPTNRAPEPTASTAAATRRSCIAVEAKARRIQAPACQQVTRCEAETRKRHIREDKGPAE